MDLEKELVGSKQFEQKSEEVQPANAKKLGARFLGALKVADSKFRVHMGTGAGANAA